MDSQASSSSSEDQQSHILVATVKKQKKNIRKVLFMGIPQELMREKKKSSKKPAKIQNSKPKAIPRKAIMISRCSMMPYPPPFTPYMQPNNLTNPTVAPIIQRPGTATMSQFLDRFTNHVPSSFDIIQRGQIPGLKIENVLIC